MSGERERREIAVWLADQFFPYDWQSKVPAPAWLRRELAAAYVDRNPGGGSFEEWEDTMKLEQAWTDEGSGSPEDPDA